jgi:hypothetical protein
VLKFPKTDVDDPGFVPLGIIIEPCEPFPAELS